METATEEIFERTGLREDQLRDLGVIRCQEGDFYTKEVVRAGTTIFRLEVIARADKDLRARPIAPQEIDDLRRKLVTAEGHEVEFVALNTHYFKVPPNSYWDRWNAFREVVEPHREIYGHLLRELKKYSSGGERVLLIGCGEGEFVDTLKGHGYKPLGIDPNPENVRIARINGRAVLPFAIDSFDPQEQFDIVIDPGVLSIGVVEHEYATKIAMPKIADLLKEEGIFFQSPFSRSLINSIDLENQGLDVLNMSVPQNLMGWSYPKQFYVAEKPYF